MSSANHPILHPSGQALVIFDMDMTLVKRDTADLWCKFLFEKQILDQDGLKIRQKHSDDYHRGELDITKNFEFEFMLLNRLPPDQRHLLRQTFFENHVKPNLYQQGLERIAIHRQNRDRILISTATIDFIAMLLADYIDADACLATCGEKVSDRYTGQIAGVPNYQMGKKTNFCQWLNQYPHAYSETVFYTDSFNDLALLEHVDRPIAVNPDDKLRDIATARQWRIEQFTY